MYSHSHFGASLVWFVCFNGKGKGLSGRSFRVFIFTQDEEYVLNLNLLLDIVNYLNYLNQLNHLIHRKHLNLLIDVVVNLNHLNHLNHLLNVNSK